jgi:hypothetical protein
MNEADGHSRKSGVKSKNNGANGAAWMMHQVCNFCHRMANQKAATMSSSVGLLAIKMLLLQEQMPLTER